MITNRRDQGVTGFLNRKRLECFQSCPVATAQGEYTTGSAWTKADRLAFDAKDLRPVCSYSQKGNSMLVLNRAKEEKIIIGGNIVVQILGVRKGIVKLGIEAPKDVPIFREELANKIAEEQAAEHLADPDCD